MSLTDKNSVLILGAGVSAPFGLPLGGDLIEAIRGRITTERSRLFPDNALARMQSETRLTYAAFDDASFFRNPLHGAIAFRHRTSEMSFDVARVNSDLERLAELETLLRGQTSETIDDFIVENPGVSDLTKLGIAVQLIQHCYELPEEDHPRFVRARSFSERAFQGQRNWIHLLINIIRHGIRKGEVTPERKIKIITFNYDRILQHVFDKQFSNTQAKHPHYSQFVEIMHVHGCLSAIDDKPRGLPEMAVNGANGIHVVNEPNPPEHLVALRRTAREAVLEAEEIYCVGFSFSGPNCKLIGLDQISRGASAANRKAMYFCNYDGNMGVKRSAEKLSSKSHFQIEEAAGQLERPLGVAEWLKAGHLGELPG